jgi:ubiquinol-cytochrome c reductase cytochrome b subunit
MCLGLQRRDRDKVLHGRESGIIKRLPHGEFIEVHEPLSQDALHTLTAHEQYKPLEIGPTTDDNGVERKVKGSEKLRAKLSEAYFGEESQIAKPTVEEYKEITSGHGHH